MFNSIIFLVIIVFSLLIFAIPGTLKYLFTLTLIVAGALLTSVWSISVLTGAEQLKEIILLPPSFGSGMVLIVDKLTAFFLIVINITVIIGFFMQGHIWHRIKRG